MEALILEPSLYTVKAVIILDNDGERLFAKYYDDTYPSVKEQKTFEKNIFNKTPPHRQCVTGGTRDTREIALLEGLTVVYKSSIDLYFYVIGSSYENELMLTAVLNCLFDSLSQMLRVGGGRGGHRGPGGAPCGSGGGAQRSWGAPVGLEGAQRYLQDLYSGGVSPMVWGGPQ
ncbi:hypothetical protein Q9233_017340, partial [Columba guinea]